MTFFSFYVIILHMFVSKLYEKTTSLNKWEELNSTRAELICPKEIDFSIANPGQSKNYLKTALKIILFPLFIYEAVRWVIQRLIMVRVYPAQSILIKAIVPQYKLKYLDETRANDSEEMRRKGFIVRHVCFERNGEKISGILIGHKDTIHNGKWALQATGNIQPVDLGVSLIGEIYHKQNYNVLMLNNPGIGRSEGTATPDTIGSTQQMGIEFLETALKAKKIILAGYSMGGGAISLAILKHNFKKDVQYLVIRQMSYNRVSEVCRHVLNWSWAPAIVKWADCEIDSLPASRKLQELGISEVIIQSCDQDSRAMHDGAIPDPATLHHGVENELELDDTKIFIGIPFAHHTDDRIKDATITSIGQWESFQRKKFPHSEITSKLP